MNKIEFNNNLINEKNELDLRYLEFNKLKELGVQNIYTLKNLDFSITEDNLQKDENYLKIAHLFAIDSSDIISVHQTHSKNILIIRNDDDLKLDRNNYDGIITTRNDIAISTRNADCILFAIYDENKKILGNIHSGWKGTVKRIMEKTLNIFLDEFKSNPKDIHVFISPSIRYCHFEVEKDVRDIFEKEFVEVDSNKYIKEIENNKYLIDTIYLNKYMMKKYGIIDKNIYDSNLCSICFKNDIHSYRGSNKEDKFKRAALVLKMD